MRRPASWRQRLQVSVSEAIRRAPSQLAVARSFLLSDGVLPFDEELAEAAALQRLQVPLFASLVPVMILRDLLKGT